MIGSSLMHIFYIGLKEKSRFSNTHPLYLHRTQCKVKKQNCILLVTVPYQKVGVGTTFLPHEAILDRVPGILHPHSKPYGAGPYYYYVMSTWVLFHIGLT